jgi:uncharacterized protein YdaU (DUF1376 family)
MAKDPAFLFYPNDWIGGTMGMTFEEKGAYMELLMLQFNRGHMTSHMIGQTVGQLWDKIQDKFIQDKNGRWYNVRLEQEQIRRKSFTASRYNNLEGVNQYTKKRGHINGHITSHMENENVNVNENINKDKGGVGEKEEMELISEIMQWFGFSEMRNPDKQSQLFGFVKVLKSDGRVEYFKEQFLAYKKHKEESNEIRHGFTGFLGTRENRYTDGGWNSRNWSKELAKPKPGGLMKPNYDLINQM